MYKMNKKLTPFLFLILLFGIAFYYDYFEILQKRPQSIHRWRQTDSGSIALNYYQNGMHFFKPEVFSQVADGGHSGYTVSEFPGLYYFIACLWKIFGYNDMIYRLTTMLIFFLGLFALFRLLQRLLKDDFWAMAISFVFFTSPVVIYYANSFITDVPAFSFSLVGWNLLLKFYEQKKQRYFIYSFLFFTLAGLLKVVALISPIALSGLYLLGTFYFKKDSAEQSLFRLNFKVITAFVLCFSIVFAWYAFAIHYNKIHNSIFFSTQTFPIWDLSKDQIASVWKDIKEYWFYEYYNVSVQLFFLLSFIWSLIYFKKQNKFLITITLFLFVGVILFSLFWYAAFGSHDYYIINPLILPLFSVIMFADYLNREQMAVFKSTVIKSVFGIFLLFNVNYADNKLNERYNGWINDYPVYKDVHTVTPYLRSIGIQRTDKVICLPDPTPNYTLYLMNQPGWTQEYDYNMDSAKLYSMIQLGAKYLIITESEPYSRPYLKSYLITKIGEYGSISIFKL